MSYTQLVAKYLEERGLDASDALILANRYASQGQVHGWFAVTLAGVILINLEFTH